MLHCSLQPPASFAICKQPPAFATRFNMVICPQSTRALCSLFTIHPSQLAACVNAPRKATRFASEEELASVFGFVPGARLGRRVTAPRKGGAQSCTPPLGRPVPRCPHQHALPWARDGVSPAFPPSPAARASHHAPGTVPPISHDPARIRVILDRSLAGDGDARSDDSDGGSCDGSSGDCSGGDGGGGCSSGGGGVGGHGGRADDPLLRCGAGVPWAAVLLRHSEIVRLSGGREADVSEGPDADGAGVGPGPAVGSADALGAAAWNRGGGVSSMRRHGLFSCSGVRRGGMHRRRATPAALSGAAGASPLPTPSTSQHLCVSHSLLSSLPAGLPLRRHAWPAVPLAALPRHRLGASGAVCGPICDRRQRRRRRRRHQ